MFIVRPRVGAWLLLSLLWASAVGNIAWERTMDVESDLLHMIESWESRPYRLAFQSLIQHPQLHHFYVHSVFLGSSRFLGIFGERVLPDIASDPILQSSTQWRQKNFTRTLRIIHFSKKDYFKICENRMTMFHRFSQVILPDSWAERNFMVSLGLAPFTTDDPGNLYCIYAESPTVSLQDGLQFVWGRIRGQAMWKNKFSAFMEHLLIEFLFTLTVFHDKLNMYHGGLSLLNTRFGESNFQGGPFQAIQRGRAGLLLDGFENSWHANLNTPDKLSFFYWNDLVPPEVASFCKSVPTNEPGTFDCPGYVFDPLKREEVFAAGQILNKIYEMSRKFLEYSEVSLYTWVSTIDQMIQVDPRDRPSAKDLLMQTIQNASSLPRDWRVQTLKEVRAFLDCTTQTHKELKCS